MCGNKHGKCGPCFMQKESAESTTDKNSAPNEASWSFATRPPQCVD